MQKLYALAAASVLFLGLSSSAVAAPVIVTYGLAPGPGATASYGWAGGGTGSGPLGGAMVVVYNTGTLAPGGSLGPVGSIQLLSMGLSVPWTIFGGGPGYSANAMAVGFGMPGVRTASGVANFAGTTFLPAGYFPGPPPNPTFAGTGTLGVLPAGATGTILINGAGTQNVMGLPFGWTLSGIVGVEVAPRVFVPEPGTGVLLLGGLAGLAGLAGAGRRLRR